MSAIALRGQSIIGIGNEGQTKTGAAELVSLCHKLLSSKGEASDIALSFEILSFYQNLDSDEKSGFFEALYDQFSTDLVLIDTAARAYLEDPSIPNMGLLAEATEPTRRKSVIRLNQAPDATQMLIEMRADLLTRLARDEKLKEVDRDFSKLFTSWFNGGFLQLQKLDWSSPTTVLENIMRYEAVHGMSGWEELRKRIVQPDRLIYGFFHPRLSDEPLIFIEVAQMAEMPDQISTILDGELPGIDPAEATTAVFFSISNCQKGLRGVPFGSFLIKQVVQDLKDTYPHLKEYVTHSPVPGIGKWSKDPGKNQSTKSPVRLTETAASKIETETAASKIAQMHDLDWISDIAQIDNLKPIITGAMAGYINAVKNDRMQPVDPVSRFHLGNGARLRE